MKDELLFDQHKRVQRDENGKLVARQDLLKSMARYGYRIEEPITACRNDDGTLAVVDGHERLIAAQALGIPFHYIVCNRNDTGDDNGR